jgi:two-component sensor histidine kinase
MPEVQDHQPSTEWKRFVSELRHRLMNHVQMITSVVNFQASRVEDPRIAAALRGTQNRVRAITGALGTHSSRDLTTLHFGNYLQWLVRELIAEYDASDLIEQEVVTCDMAIGLDKGIPLALIANELVANTLEHAFPDGRGGKIRVRLAYAAVPPVDGAEAVARGELEVTDYGLAMPSEAFDAGQTTGFILIRTLTSQLQGEITLENCPGLKTFRLRFPLDDGQ